MGFRFNMEQPTADADPRGICTPPPNFRKSKRRKQNDEKTRGFVVFAVGFLEKLREGLANLDLAKTSARFEAFGLDRVGIKFCFPEF